MEFSIPDFAFFAQVENLLFQKDRKTEPKPNKSQVGWYFHTQTQQKRFERPQRHHSGQRKGYGCLREYLNHMVPAWVFDVDGPENFFISTSVVCTHVYFHNIYFPISRFSALFELQRI